MPTAYDAMLTQRARVWGLLCRARHSDSSVTIDDLYGPTAREDVDDLLGRLKAASYVTIEGGGVRLTERGRTAADRTFREGYVPGVVMKGPKDWRTRAWQAMRIHRAFEIADIAATCDAPSYHAVRRYCVDLVGLGVLRQHGKAKNGRLRYRLVRDEGPNAPRKPLAKRAIETRPDRDWRRRAWSAIKRIAASGEAVTTFAVSAAASLPHWHVYSLLEDLRGVGALQVVDRRRSARDGSELLFELVVGSEQAARRVVRRSRRPNWRSIAWGLVLTGDVVTANAVTNAGGVHIDTAQRFLRGLLRMGFVERRFGRRPSDNQPAGGAIPYEYLLAVPNPPLECPHVDLKPSSSEAGLTSPESEEVGVLCEVSDG